MMEYRMSFGNKTFMYAFGAILSGIAIILLCLAIQRQHWAMLIPAGILGAIGYLLFRTGARVLLTIDESSVVVCNGFSTTSVSLDEVAGFREGANNTLLLELSSGGKSLKIPGTLERRKELKDWVERRFTDIAVEAAKAVNSEVLHDERYGLTEEDRARRLKQARKIALYGTLGTPVLLIWVLISPQPYEILMLILLAIPFAAVWLIWYYKGILRLYSSKTKPYPSMMFVILIAVGAAFFAVLREYDIYSVDTRSWELLLAVSVVVALVWAVAGRASAAIETNLFKVYLTVWLLAGVYTYNVLLFSNCAYDHQKAAIYRVGVDGMHSTSGKSTHYYLDLSPWGRFSDGKRVQVSRSFYHQTQQGDSVNVYLHPGKWGIQWYEVTHNRTAP